MSFVKTGKKKKGELATVHYADVFGTKKVKYEYLEETLFDDVAFKKVSPSSPYYFFSPKNDNGKEEYSKGFGLAEVMPNNRTAVLTMGDSFVVADTKQQLVDRIEDLNANSYTEEQLKGKYGLGKNYAAFVLSGLPLKIDEKIVRYAYRPFDYRWVCFDSKTVWRQRMEVMKHLYRKENVSMTVCKQLATNEWNLVNVAEGLVDDCFVSNRTKERGYVFPLYLYEENFGKVEKRPNFNAEVYDKMAVEGPSGSIGIIADMGLAPAFVGVDETGTLKLTYAMPKLAITSFDPQTGVVRFKVTPGEGNQIVSEIATGYLHVYGTDNLGEKMRYVSSVGFDLTPYLKSDTKGEGVLNVTLGTHSFLKIKVESVQKSNGDIE